MRRSLGQVISSKWHVGKLLATKQRMRSYMYTVPSNNPTSSCKVRLIPGFSSLLRCQIHSNLPTWSTLSAISFCKAAIALFAAWSWAWSFSCVATSSSEVSLSLSSNSWLLFLRASFSSVSLSLSCSFDISAFRLLCSFSRSLFIFFTLRGKTILKI